jgi:uncharacterized damage-inducible protein DinB
MHKEYLVKLYDYNFTMNHELLYLISSLHFSDKKIINVFSHLLQAEKIWLMRLQGDDLSGQNIWPELTIQDCELQVQKNKDNYSDYLKNVLEHHLLGNLNYTTSQGKEFNTPVIDILIHVIIHSGYHRGQIAAKLRDLGGEPINTDYIHYVRSYLSNK